MSELSSDGLSNYSVWSEDLIAVMAVVFINTVTASYSCGHRLCILTAVTS